MTELLPLKECPFALIKRKQTHHQSSRAGGDGGDIEDNSNVIFLISKQKHVMTPH